ncbi:MAG TPA: GlsB/YeaQ/YmgE family stress response membrane protein [Solirubrobacteraceae bacterium]|nr:GlsB/YeaQ/YmgE family stress response membrane protein [Solirubrobacteraceae bacterium]
MIGEIIAAIFIGLIAGFLGRALLPGDDSMGLVATIAVGIVGALLGWVLFAFLLGIGDNDKFDLGSIVGAIIGTMIVLLLVRTVRGGRGRTATGRV